jgi:peptide/nickel transport system substrate-binding protein
VVAGKDGKRRFGGAPVHYTIDVIEGWSDWITAASMIGENLTAIGIPVEVRTRPYAALTQKIEAGEFELCIMWGPRGPTPYTFYRSQMGSALVHPVGTRSLENWHRFGSKDADAALNRFEAAPTNEELKALTSKLQETYVENAPSLPLFTNLAWAEYTETRFTGFPNAANPYARLSPYSEERLLVMMELRPKQDAR